MVADPDLGPGNPRFVVTVVVVQQCSTRQPAPRQTGMYKGKLYRGARAPATARTNGNREIALHLLTAARRPPNQQLREMRKLVANTRHTPALQPTIQTAKKPSALYETLVHTWRKTVSRLTQSITSGPKTSHRNRYRRLARIRCRKTTNHCDMRCVMRSAPAVRLTPDPKQRAPRIKLRGATAASKPEQFLQKNSNASRACPVWSRHNAWIRRMRSGQMKYRLLQWMGKGWPSKQNDKRRTYEY